MGNWQIIAWLSLVAYASVGHGCTTIAVTKSASTDGSTMVTHTSDCVQCDSRVARIPAREYPEGAMRPIYSAKLEYPREVSDRSPTYEPEPGQEMSTPAGFIPQVRRTYAYWEAVYGYMNEHGLTLGESTAAANYPVDRSNMSALLWVRPLTQLAMERCKTARCAVQTMGGLSEQYGFYGEDPGASGAGECLLIVDGTEVWAFEITGDPTGRSAFWAARRVPDGHVVAVANNFVLRGIDCDDTENFMCSTDLLARAKAAGAWSGRGAFDWATSMGPDIREFSYTPGFAPIPEYTTARLWRVFSRVAPTLNIQRTDNPRAVPFSVVAEWKISARDLMDLKRDHYEGTDIDLTTGAFAGPFGSPYRLEGGKGLKTVRGQFARAISLPRTSYCTLGQSYGSHGATTGQHGLDKLWFASDTPASSVFVPFYSNASSFASAYRTGNMNVFNESCAWWVFDFVANWMQINYEMMSVDVKAKINELQDFIDQRMQSMEGTYLAGNVGDVEVLGKFQEQIQNNVVDSWRSFGHSLIVKYNDGVLNLNGIPQSIGYPAWWLQMFGLDDDIRPKWAMPSSFPPRLYISVQPAMEFLAHSHRKAAAALPAVIIEWLPTLAANLVIFAAGWTYGRRGRSADSDYRIAPS